ncbi:amidohydrolase family protein [Geminicoccaceae bacterium 1502E]|nr:amidohydrolase family protein [Geminicoccaceae bacterium 1502E]
MPDVAILDSHVHLYDPRRVGYGWMRAVPKLDRPYLPADFHAHRKEVEVEGIVFVEVAADPGRHLEEAAWVEAQAACEPLLKAMVAHAPLEKGAAVEEDLAALRRHPLLRGVRRLLQQEEDPAFALRPGFIEGVRQLAAFDLSFDICVYHHQLPAAIELARRCPEVRFVLDHIGKPAIREGLMEPWARHMRELAGLANVSCKISGVITEADHERWTPESIRPWVEHAIDCFGFERVMFGSDWTVALLTHDYPRWVAILDGFLEGASLLERRRFWRDNAVAFYRL